MIDGEVVTQGGNISHITDAYIPPNTYIHSWGRELKASNVLAQDRTAMNIFRLKII